MKTFFKTLLVAIIAATTVTFGMSASTSASSNGTATTVTQKKAGTSTKSKALVLNAKSLGGLTIGMSKASIPATVAGLYTSKSYTRINHDENMDCPSEIHGYYTCSLKGKETCYIYINNKNTVCGIYVTTPTIKSSEGVKTGMSEASVKKIAGMQFQLVEMGNSYYVGKAGIDYILYDDNPDIISAMAIGLYY